MSCCAAHSYSPLCALNPWEMTTTPWALPAGCHSRVKILMPPTPSKLASVMIRPTAQAKSISVELDVAPDAGEAMFDRGRFQQVLSNLLSNAVKFTSDGGRVSLRIRKIDGQIEAVVADNGQGIEAAFLPHLFQRFRRADMSKSADQPTIGVDPMLVMSTRAL